MKNNINIARFDADSNKAKVRDIWQWDYGQILRIQGLNLPTAVEIHFSLDEHGGEAVRRIGVTKDGVTDVPIPDSMVENESAYGDSYYFFVYIYLTDETSGNTEYKIRAKVSTRSKPEAFVSGGNDTFAEILKTVNEIAEDKVDVPVPAKVGQVITVSEVDEDGRPTGFEATPIEESDPTVPEWAKQPEKPTYTAEEVGALPVGTKIPSKTSELMNDSGFLTEHQDLSGYATKDEIPKTASEVGADASGTAESKVSAHNVSDTAHNDIRLLVQGLTERLNALADSDDATLDQMSEVVAYIKSNKSLIDAITTSKVNVSDIIDNLTTNVSNKPLSAAQGVKLKALIDAITAVELDESLSDNTKAAPAGMVGELKGDIGQLSDDVNELKNNGTGTGSGLSSTEKGLMITLFRNMLSDTDMTETVDTLETLWNGGSVEQDSYTIKYNLTNVTSSESTSSVTSGGSFTTTLSAMDGFKLHTVMITMSGIDVTNSVYSDGVVMIPRVTGNIVISAIGISNSDAQAWEDGVAYDITPIVGEFVDSNTGEFKAADGYHRTDYFPCFGVEWIYLIESTLSNPYNAFYDANKNFISNFMTAMKYIEVPENASYFVMSRRTDEVPFSAIPLADVKATWEDGVAYTLTPFIENEYTKTNGEFTIYNNWKRTDYINCVHASKLTLSTGCQYGAFYNSKYELVSGSNRWTDKTEITVPVGACYFSVSNTNAVMDTLVITPSA